MVLVVIVFFIFINWMMNWVWKSIVMIGIEINNVRINFWWILNGILCWWFVLLSWVMTGIKVISKFMLNKMEGS